MPPSVRAVVMSSLLVTGVSCRERLGPTEAERIFTDAPATWVVPLPEARISPGGTRAVFGSGRWRHIVDLETGQVIPEPDSETPGDASNARTSPDGIHIATFNGSTVTVDGIAHVLDGAVRALEWEYDANDVLTLVTHDDGGSSLVRIRSEDRGIETVARDLDAPLRGSTIGVVPDEAIVYLALASEGPIDLEARHDPDAARDLGVYAVDLTTGAKRLVVDTEMDELSPKLAGEYLYWTRVDYRQSVVALPIAGGETHLVAEGGQLPYWRHDGGAIGYTVGLPLAADAPLNMDADVIEVDENAEPTSKPKRIIRGYHEDFTPAWSPDGRWLAFHSHRSPAAVPGYRSEGSTDDLYLLRSGAPTENEIRLTDFGWEAGMADWSPDGARLVFVTWEEGAPGIGIPYIVTIDPKTGAPRDVERIALPEPLRSARLAAWSPTAEAIALENDEGDGQQSIWVLALETGALEHIVDFASDTYSGVDWTPDGEMIVFAALEHGAYQIYRVPASGGEREKLSHDSGQLLQPQVSPDGRFIAATRIEATRELWRRER